MEINKYSTTYPASKEEADYSKLQTKKTGLDMQDFLNLIVAQMSNQDPMNPMENTDFIAQMAQFSALEAMSDLREVSMQGQVTSLIGKNVVVSYFNSRGELDIQEGIVQRVTLHGSEAILYVNDKEYKYSNVMEIKEISKQEENLVEKILTDILEETKKANKTTEQPGPVLPEKPVEVE